MRKRQITGKIEFKFKIYSDLRCTMFKAVNRQFSCQKKCDVEHLLELYQRWHHGDTKLAQTTGARIHLNFFNKICFSINSEMWVRETGLVAMPYRY